MPLIEQLDLAVEQLVLSKCNLYDFMQVPLDYSLHSYLELMFLEPKMKFYVQGTLVALHA